MMINSCDATPTLLAVVVVAATANPATPKWERAWAISKTEETTIGLEPVAAVAVAAKEVSSEKAGQDFGTVVYQDIQALSLDFPERVARSVYSAGD